MISRNHTIYNTFALEAVAENHCEYCSLEELLLDLPLLGEHQRKNLSLVLTVLENMPLEVEEEWCIM